MGIVPKMKSLLSGKAASTRELVNNIVLSFGVKGLSLLVVLATTPAYLAYFDDGEILGLWFTLISILTWILTCDMGVGNGLRNELVYALSSDDVEEAKSLVSSSYVFLCSVAGVVLLAVLFLANAVNWFVVFNIDESSISFADLKTAITIILLSVVIQFVLRLITSVLYSLQKAFLPGFISLLTNAALLVYCLWAPAAGVRYDIVSLAIVYAFAVNVPLLLTSVFVFTLLRPDIRPSFRAARKDLAFRVLKLGAAFLWLQFMALLLNNSSSYLIALLMGNTQVVEYQIYYRIFTIASTVSLLCTTPVWSAATKAKSEGNYAWLWKIYKLFAILSVVAAMAEFVLCLPLQTVFNFWLGAEAIEVSWTSALMFALYGSLIVWSNVVTTFANGLQELRLQTVFLTIGAFANIPIAIIFSHIFGSYLAIVASNIIAYLPYLLVQTIWMTGHLRTMAEGRLASKRIS